MKCSKENERNLYLVQERNSKSKRNAFNAHLKKVVRDLEATRSLNAQLTRRLEIREKQLHGYQGGGNEYA